jgi:hypothetical protein
VGDPLDALTITDPSNQPVDVVNTGFLVPDEAAGPSSTLVLEDVDLEGVTAARLAVSAWYCAPCVAAEEVAMFTLRYRVNENPWIDRQLNAQEAENITSGNGRGAVGHVLDVPLGDLVSGTNTVEFVGVNITQTYPPGVTNVDLVLDVD